MESSTTRTLARPAPVAVRRGSRGVGLVDGIGLDGQLVHDRGSAGPAGGEVAQVDQQQERAVVVDGGAGRAGHRAEELAEPLHHDLALALHLVDGPGQRLAREPGDDRDPRHPAAGDAQRVAEVGERHGLVVADDDEGSGDVVHRGVGERDGLEDARDRDGVALGAAPHDQAAHHARGSPAA